VDQWRDLYPEENIAATGRKPAQTCTDFTPPVQFAAGMKKMLVAKPAGLFLGCKRSRRHSLTTVHLLASGLKKKRGKPRICLTFAERKIVSPTPFIHLPFAFCFSCGQHMPAFQWPKLPGLPVNGQQLQRYASEAPVRKSTSSRPYMNATPRLPSRRPYYGWPD
jgi:hypothetical protein